MSVKQPLPRQDIAAIAGGSVALVTLRGRRRWNRYFSLNPAVETAPDAIMPGKTASWQLLPFHLEDRPAAGIWVELLPDPEAHQLEHVAF
jgi:hypothetical protein